MNDDTDQFKELIKDWRFIAGAALIFALTIAASSEWPMGFAT